MTINGGIQGSFGITKTGNGTLILQDTNFGTNSVSNTSSTFSGDTVIRGGLLQITAANVLQQSTLDYNNYGGNLSFATLSAATFGGLKGAQNLPLTNDSAGNVNLTIGNNIASNVYSGSLSGGGSVTKVGAGTQTFSGNNIYTGGTTLTAGELSVSADANIGGLTSAITFNGGILGITGTTLTNLDTHTVNWSTFNGGFDVADPTNTVTVNPNIAGTGGMIKRGAGTLLLTGNNSYSGTTKVQGGKLVMRGDAARAPIFSGGGADITSGQLVLDYSPGGSTNPAGQVNTALTAGFAQTLTPFATGAANQRTG